MGIPLEGRSGLAGSLNVLQADLDDLRTLVRADTLSDFIWQAVRANLMDDCTDLYLRLLDKESKPTRLAILPRKEAA